MKTALYASVGIACLLPFLVNCSGMSFAAGPGAANSAASSDNNPNPSPTPTPVATPTPTPTPAPPPAGPSLKFVGPPCQRGTNCQVEFEMTAAVSGTFQFSWATNDTLYLQTPPAGVTYGKPNVDYVPASGEVIFTPGETMQQVFVQNVNPTTASITIGVIMTSCSYNGVTADCDTFFH